MTEIHILGLACLLAIVVSVFLVVIYLIITDAIEALYYVRFYFAVWRAERKEGRTKGTVFQLLTWLPRVWWRAFTYVQPKNLKLQRSDGRSYVFGKRGRLIVNYTQ